MSDIKQVTLFGGTGFIGRHFVRRLARTGAIIRVPTRNIDNALILKPMGDIGKIVPMTCSVRGDAMVANAIGNSDVVVNLTGILHESGGNTFQSVHVEAAARIARLAKEHSVKHFVHVSSLAADAHSSSIYARSKATGEEAVRTFYPFATILRPSIIFGPEDNFFNRFASMACIAPALPLIGGGGTRFQPVYVGDVADAIMAALSQPQARAQVYELGGPQVYSFRAMMELMLKEIGRNRKLVNVPYGLATLKAWFLEKLPNPMLTRDQVELLKTDNVVHNGAKTLGDLGINPTSLEMILPLYMQRFRKGGSVMGDAVKAAKTA